MDEIHENETSAKKHNSEIKLKIMISLSNLITEVEHDSVLTSENVVERLIAIIKMFTIKSGDMKNNKEARCQHPGQGWQHERSQEGRATQQA